MHGAAHAASPQPSILPAVAGDGEPTPAEPTRGMPDLVFPLVTHGKILVLQRPLGMMGVSAFVPRSPFFFFFLKDLWYENIWDPDLPVELASPEGIFPPPVHVCRAGCANHAPAAAWEAARLRSQVSISGGLLFLSGSYTTAEKTWRVSTAPCQFLACWFRHACQCHRLHRDPPQGSPQGLRHNPG